ncbi:MAG: polysaccharide biosynthesis tyrosine autokinase [Planctomycetota bacterium]
MKQGNASQDADEGLSGYRSAPTVSGVEEKPVPTIDFMGGLWRRKSIVLLLATVGAGLGWLCYARETPTYMSRMRIMLWTQAPPSVIEGDSLPQRIALEKHRTLISRTFVLKTAFEAGGLAKLKTFANSQAPYGDLRGMLNVSAVGNDGSSDALEIRCEGKIAQDLEPILIQVVDKFIAATTEDYRELGEKSMELIKDLQTKLEQDKSAVQTRYYQLVKDLGLITETEEGSLESPFLADLEKMKTQKDEHLRDYRKSDQLLREIQEILSSEQPDVDAMKLAAIEARKFLNLAEPEDEYSTVESEEQQRLVRYEQRLESITGEVLALEAERSETARRFGENHPQVEFISSKYRTALVAKNRLMEELDSLRSITDNESLKTKKVAAVMEDARLRDAELVRIYAVALRNQRERAKYNLEKSDEDIQLLTEKSKDTLEDWVEVNMLRDQIKESGASVSQVLEKLAALEVIANEKNYSATRVKIIDDPSAPRKIAPEFSKFLLIGTLLGGLLGAALAVLIDHSDLAYRTPIDIQESMNVPVLCKIPRIKKLKLSHDFKGSPMLVTALSPGNSASETFRAARTSLLFAAGQNGHRVLMLTSPSPGDGKSTTAANLAISLAQTDKKVCLVDSDFRRPKVKENFGIQDDIGCMQYLNGKISLEEAMHPCAIQSNLTLLTTGGYPTNPGELVSSTPYAEMIAELKSRFDFVLIDCPPVIPVADATSICSLVDGIIMVLRIRRGVILSAQKAKERLDLVQGNLMGIIVNGMDQNSYYNEYGTYYRGAYYGSNYFRFTYPHHYSSKYAEYSDSGNYAPSKKA